LGEAASMDGDFRVDDWLVRPQANSVEKDGQTWHLEPKIMQVLVELASHQNEVLSKDRLLETVWHNTFVGEDALVRCISEIRNVFRDDPKSSRVIQTIPKSGYRLIATVTVDARKPGSSPRLELEPKRTLFQSTFPKSPQEQSTSHPNGAIASKEPTGVERRPGVVQEFPSPGTTNDDSGASIRSIDSVEVSLLHATPNRKPANRRAKIVRVAVLAVSLLACLGLAYVWKTTQRSPVDSFWEPLLDGNDPVLICLADQLQNNQISLRDASDPRRIIPVQVNLPYVVLDDLGPLMKVSGVLQTHHKPYVLKGEGAINLNDLQTGPVVLIGAYDNAWTLRLTSQLRFHFWNSPDLSQQRIVDTTDPAQTKWSSDRAAQQITGGYRDYAIVARFTDANTGRVALVIAGIGSGATIAGGEFVTDTNGLAQLEHAAQATGGKKNMEVVLSTEVIDGHPGSGKIEAMYFW
jgi:DNA-binding winged helix-turn-helix (wHTH) protein